MVMRKHEKSLPHNNNAVFPNTKGFPSHPEDVNAIENNSKDQRLESNVELGKNGEDAIKEVEEIIRRNPELPRLTRGEILDILENITKQDQRMEAQHPVTNRDPKALVVVKAYTPLGSEQNKIEELYTKPPIISIVNDENEQQPQTENLIRTTTPRATTYFRKKTRPSIEDKNAWENKNFYRTSSSTTTASTNKPHRGNVQFRTTFSTTTEQSTTTTTQQSQSQPTIPHIKKRRRRPQFTTERATVTTYHPRRQSTPLRKEVKNKYTEENIINTKLIPDSYELDDLIPQENKIVALSRNKSTIENRSNIEIGIPEHLRKTFSDLNLVGIDDKELITTTLQPQQVKYRTSTLPPALIAETSTSSPMENAQLVAGNLPPDMQNLLISFGLLPDPKNKDHKENEVSNNFNPETASIRPESYVGFKPLPEDSRGRKEMEDLLEKFGLLNRNERNSKSLKNDKLKSKDDTELKLDDISLDVIPADLRPLVNEMGFRSARRIREKPNDELLSAGGNNLEINKISRLLEIVKTLAKKNDTITEEDLKSIDRDELKHLLTSLNSSNKKYIISLDKQKAPSPLAYNSIEINKKEVKREDDEQSTTTTRSTTTEESEKPSIKDLEDSFGGSSDDSNAEASKLPENGDSSQATKPNGFYYLLDWNSFFEIDDQKGKRVNLRFQPKVGDPKRFFSVTVP